MKRVLTIIIALLMVLSSMAYAIGCTSKPSEETTANVETTSTKADVTETTEKDTTASTTATTTSKDTTVTTTEETTTEETTTEEPEPEYLRPVVDFNDFEFVMVEQSEID
jgi:flagellar basal body-associated protein FliL